MSQSNVFDSQRLRDNLTRATIKNCRVEIRPDGVKTLRFRGITDVRVAFAPHAMRALSEHLYKLIPLNGSLSANLLARHMSQVAILAGHLELTVLGQLPAMAKQIELLERRISTDFALICAISLAHDHGYMISPEISQWEVMHSVLRVKDDDSLVQQFRESLAKVSTANKLAHEVIASGRVERVLSAASYANLAAVASAEDWDDRMVRILIEEYLSPMFHPSIVHYSNIVSGEEWRQLYDNTCRLFSDARHACRAYRI